MKEASSAGHSHVLTPSPWTSRLVNSAGNSSPHDQHKIFVILMALMACLVAYQTQKLCQISLGLQYTS